MTAAAGGGLADLLHRGEQEREHQGDDGQGDEELDEGDGAPHSASINFPKSEIILLTFISVNG